MNSRLSENHACHSLCQEIWDTELKEILWHEMCSEYDARKFAGHFRTSKIELSTEFRRFEKSWLRDENNHYLGFRYLYSTLYQVPIARLALLVRVRAAEFSQLAHFVEDEFYLCVLLAYDEIVTANAYAGDFPIYDALGDPDLSAWIRSVCCDEVHHFRGAIELLRLLYAPRLGEVSDLLDELIEHDTQPTDYSGTFVLDHQHYPPSLLERARRAVMKACDAPNH